MLALVSHRLAEATTVDYEKDVVATYTAFSKAWLEAHGSLELLKYCGASGEHYVCDERLPSWVVDLTQEVRMLQLRHYEAITPAEDLQLTTFVSIDQASGRELSPRLLCTRRKTTQFFHQRLNSHSKRCHF